MSMLRGSVKIDRGVLKTIFCGIFDLYHIRRGGGVLNWLYLLPYPPCYFILISNIIFKITTAWWGKIGYWWWYPTWFPSPCKCMQTAWSWSFCDFSAQYPWPRPVEHSVVQFPCDPSTIIDLGWRPIYNTTSLLSLITRPWSELPCAVG